MVLDRSADEVCACGTFANAWATPNPDLRGKLAAALQRSRICPWARGHAPVAHDPARRIDPGDPAFLANDPATWGVAPAERQVRGLAVHDRRLFNSVASEPEIWSVALGTDGAIQQDARLEIRVAAPVADPVFHIAFDAEGSMFLAQPGLIEANYDYTKFASPQRAARGLSWFLKNQASQVPTGFNGQIIAGDPFPSDCENLSGCLRPRSSCSGILLCHLQNWCRA